MDRFRIVSAGLVLSLGAGLIAALPSSAAPAVDGVWRTDGYGSIVAIDNGKVRHFDTTSISCAPAGESEQTGPPDAHGATPYAGRGRTFTVRTRHDRGTLHLDGSVGDRRLIRLPALPIACGRPRPTGPLATFDEFWTTYAENYPFFAAKGIDWRAVRDRYRPRVTAGMSDDALFDLLAEMIRPLGDAHTAIQAGDRVYAGQRPGTIVPDLAYEQKIRPYIERVDLGHPLKTYANDLIGYADLPGRIGYLRVILFMGYGDLTWTGEVKALDAALDQIFSRQRVDRLRGLIVDLRVNGGGSDELALRLTSRLTGRPHLAYLKRNRNDADDPARYTRPQPIHVRPVRPAYTGPLVLLTAGSTVSAGETFTQSLMDRHPRPVRIGANTQGVFSDVLERTLPNGWDFQLPNEEFRTRRWESYDGPGIPPHVRTPVFTDEELATGRDSAFAAALRLLR